MDAAKLKSLREERGRITEEMRNILAAAEGENRQPTADELGKHTELYNKQESIRQQIEAAERQEAVDREMAERASEAEAENRGTPGSEEERVMATFNDFLRTGRIAGEGLEEFRALQAGADTEGGYLIAPERFVRDLIRFVDDMVFVRAHANVLPPLTESAKLGVPSLDTDVSDFDWTTELATGSEDSDLAFGKRQMEPHPMAKRVKVSNPLLRLSSLDAEGLVRARLGYKVGVTQEKGYLTGSGASQPLGVFTASSDGISTARDVSDGNTTTELRFDGLIAAKFALKGQYWNGARWMFHRDAVEQITKLKDGEGRYIWQPSVREGQPDRILNLPYDMSEFAPNTFTTGQYVGILAHWSHYWIVDSLNFQVQRLVELYAETNQVGFIGRYEGDGMPVLEEAFTRVKLA